MQLTNRRAASGHRADSARRLQRLCVTVCVCMPAGPALPTSLPARISALSHSVGGRQLCASSLASRLRPSAMSTTRALASNCPAVTATARRMETASRRDDDRLATTRGDMSRRRRRGRRPAAVVPSTLAVILATWVACALVRCGRALTCDIGGTGEDDDWRPPSRVEIVLQAQSIIYGRVQRTFPDTSTSYSGDYTAEMDVYCTLKGRRLDPVVNVSKAGIFQPF